MSYPRHSVSVSRRFPGVVDTLSKEKKLLLWVCHSNDGYTDGEVKSSLPWSARHGHTTTVQNALLNGIAITLVCELTANFSFLE